MLLFSIKLSGAVGVFGSILQLAGPLMVFVMGSVVISCGHTRAACTKRAAAREYALRIGSARAADHQRERENAASHQTSEGIHSPGHGWRSWQGGRVLFRR